jgi:hypothetical protein
MPAARLTPCAAASRARDLIVESLKASFHAALYGYRGRYELLYIIHANIILARQSVSER